MPNNIKISEKTHVAVRLLSHLAQAKTLKAQSLGEIAIDECISFYFLQQISRLLKKHKIISSQLGVNGGYRLTKTPNKISLKEICEAVEGPISLINCAGGCRATNCRSKALWSKINREIEKVFEQIKLSDIA